MFGPCESCGSMEELKASGLPRRQLCGVCRAADPNTILPGIPRWLLWAGAAGFLVIVVAAPRKSAPTNSSTALPARPVSTIGQLALDTGCDDAMLAASFMDCSVTARSKGRPLTDEQIAQAAREMIARTNTVPPLSKGGCDALVPLACAPLILGK